MTSALVQLTVSSMASNATAQVSGYQALGVAVAGTDAYLAMANTNDGSGLLQAVDVSNPQSPQLLTNSLPLASALSVFVSGTNASVAGGASGLSLVDVTDPANPHLLGTCNVGGAATNSYIVGNYIYVAVAGGTNGLQIVDISSPANPIVVAGVTNFSSASSVWVAGNDSYVGDAANGLNVIDVSNPAHPLWITNCPTGAAIRGLRVAGDYAYAAASEAGFMVIDVSNPTQPSVVGSNNVPRSAKGLAATGTYAFVADGANGLVALDVSSPKAPALAGTNTMLADARGVDVSGRYVFVAAGNAGLVILDAGPVVQSPPEVRVGPLDATVGQGSNAVFSVTVDGTVPLSFQWRNSGVPLPNATESSVTITNVQADAAYDVVVTNSFGAVTSSVAQLTIIPCSYVLDSLEADLDGTASSSNSFGVITSSPCPWIASTTNSWIHLFTLTGIGNGPVYYDVDANPTADARTGAIIVNDTNLFTVIQGLLTWGLEVDSASPDAGVTIGVSPRDQDGNGNGPTQLLLAYADNTTVTLAAPSTAGGNLFQKWQINGVDATNSPAVSFVIQTDLTALAVYSPPVSFLNATYNGLFYETNEISQGSSGSFKITTTPAAKYTGSLQIGATRYAISGQFDPVGNASSIITNRAQRSSLTVALQIEAVDTDVITGTVTVQTTNGTQTAALLETALCSMARATSRRKWANTR